MSYTISNFMLNVIENYVIHYWDKEKKGGQSGFNTSARKTQKNENASRLLLK